MARSLYICYFGAGEPLVQTQVIPYLRELVKGGHEMSLLTFEAAARNGEGQKGRREEEETRDRLAQEGIEWFSLPYHKQFSALATAWDIFRGTLFVRRMIRERELDILHGRSHVPTLMGALARKLSRRQPKLIFDIRGFFPEEYTDAGVWPENGMLYRAAKRVERWLLRQADGFVVLTSKAKGILFGGSDERRPVEVIPCCVDLTRFASANEANRREVRNELAVGDRFVAAYVGAFGGWYLTTETADFLGELKKARPDTFAVILTQSKRDMIEPLLHVRGYGPGDVYIAQVPATELPRYLSGADVGVSFIKNCYSKQASSPTKNAEYLACGLPIVANAGVGDVDELIAGHEVGVLVHELSPEGYADAIEKLVNFGQPASHMRAIAAREFDLEAVGGEKYRRLYAAMIGGQIE